MSEDFVLIGAGLSRTATQSTRKALKQLLGADCYHGWTLIDERDDHHQHFWKALRGEATNEDWKEVLKDYKAGLDLPINSFYKQLMEVFPEAKVLLTVRDPVSWYVSMRDSIVKVYNIQKIWPYSWFIYFTGKQEGMDVCYEMTLNQGAFAAVNAGEEAAVKFWEDHVKDVMEHVPREKLLVWNVKEGWEPLCKFLDVPVPDAPFPRLNDTQEIQNLYNTLVVSSWFVVFVIPVLLGVLGYLCSGNPLLFIMSVSTVLFAAFMIKQNMTGNVKTHVKQ